MKKIITILAIAAIMTSCTKDDSEPITDASLVGTWNLESHTMNGKAMNNYGDEFTFSSDHTVTLIESNGQSHNSGTWSLSGSDLKCILTGDGYFTYRLHINSISGNTLKWQTNVPHEGLLIETYKR